MANPGGESVYGPLRLDFDRGVKLEFHGCRITSDAGLLAYCELDDAFGLTVMAGERLADARTGKNDRHALVGLLRLCPDEPPTAVLGGPRAATCCYRHPCCRNGAQVLSKLASTGTLTSGRPSIRWMSNGFFSKTHLDSAVAGLHRVIELGLRVLLLPPYRNYPPLFHGFLSSG